MKYSYGEFDGQPFPSPDDLFANPKVMQFILQYGQQALDAMENLSEEEEQQYIQAMIDAGLLERDAETGELRMTPRLVRGLEHRALLEIFKGMKRGTREGHETIEKGRIGERTDGSRAYDFGDPVSDIDLSATMRNAHRRASAEANDSAVTPPLHINYADFEVHNTEGQTDCATCVLIDMSGSMMRWGRFYQAKRVALGMQALVRSRFPLDTIDFVGFYSLAERINEQELPLVMPKPVTVHDYEVRVRVPLEQAQEDPRMVPQHFTNLHMGLRLARQILTRRGAANKQIFVITDGQPTAHVEPSEAGGEMLYLLYPPTEQTRDITLKEALRCQQLGIDIATFALIEDYWSMDWVGFVDQLTRLTRGTAFYCSSDDLSSTVVESYLAGKKRKTFIQ